MGICDIIICNYDDSVVFYLTEKKYIYEWVVSENKKVPDQLIEDIMSNDPEAWGINNIEDLHKNIKHLNSSNSYIQKALLAFKACQDFYSIGEIHTYILENNLTIGIEAIIDI